MTWGRVIGRFAVAVPDKSKGIRKLTILPPVELNEDAGTGSGSTRAKASSS